MTKIIKNIMIIFVGILFLLLIPTKAFADDAVVKVDSVKITTNASGKVSIYGTTSGYTDNMNLLLKVMNAEGEVEYFNQVIVDGNIFKDSFIPHCATDRTILYFKVSGDLSYGSEFYYSKQYESVVDESENLVLDMLEDYKNYQDSGVAPYKMKFSFSVVEDKDMAYLTMVGTNFVKDDELWKNKSEEAWYNYLDTLIYKIHSMTNLSVKISVYDKNMVLLETYPTGIGENGTGAGDITGGDGNDFEEDGSIIEDSGNEIIKLIIKYTSYLSNGNTYKYIRKIGEVKDNFIELKFYGIFSKSDEIWKKHNASDMETFAKKVADLIDTVYNCDISLVFYDKSGYLLNSYYYYYYKVDSSSDEIKDSFEEYLPGTGTTTNNTLELADYGTNSVTVKAEKTEGMSNGKYITNLSFNDLTRLTNALNALRSDSQKVIVIKDTTDSKNVNFTFGSACVDLMVSNKALLVLDFDGAMFQVDFSDFKGTTGDLTINTAEAIYTGKAPYTDSMTIAIKVGGNEASGMFSNGITSMLHYDSESTRNISDLRLVGIRLNDEAIGTTASTAKKGFIFKYKGEGQYSAVASSVSYEDVEDSEEKRWADIVSAKGIFGDISSSEFNAEAQVSRGEFINYTNNFVKATSTNTFFTDVYTGSTVSRNANALRDLEILPPTFTAKLNPETTITREEMIFMIERCYEVNHNNTAIEGSSLVFRDKVLISAWAKIKVAAASKLKLIETDGNLDPINYGTKIYAAELFYKLMAIEGVL